jgi:hypothetical protein
MRLMTIARDLLRIARTVARLRMAATVKGPSMFWICIWVFWRCLIFSLVLRVCGLALLRGRYTWCVLRRDSLRILAWPVATERYEVPGTLAADGVHAANGKHSQNTSAHRTWILKRSLQASCGTSLEEWPARSAMHDCISYDDTAT